MSDILFLFQELDWKFLGGNNHATELAYSTSIVRYSTWNNLKWENISNSCSDCVTYRILRMFRPSCNLRVIPLSRSLLLTSQFATECELVHVCIHTQTYTWVCLDR